MKHLELHVLQSFPVSCLNRDDNNSPKSALFGGVLRGRVSSQCAKRACREEARDQFDSDGFFKGIRTKLIFDKISSRLQGLGESEEMAVALARKAGNYLGKVESDKDDRVKTMMFFSPNEFEKIAGSIYGLTPEEKEAAIKEPDPELEGAAAGRKNKKKEKVNGPMKKALQKALSRFDGLAKDAADIGLFGRMIAADSSLSVDGASMFSHALSTHEVDSEIDYFTAVDERKPVDKTGAGMVEVLEFNSATYYRFAALNLTMLAQEDHFGKTMTQEERKAVVMAFIQGFVKAVPSARRNSMNGNTMPAYVLGVIREKGHPLQLVNAFERPVSKTGKGYVLESIRRINDDYSDLVETWGIEAEFAGVTVSGYGQAGMENKHGSVEVMNLNDLIERMVDYVG
ncbi:MAG: type I-E CRISPR-associated protein Cas7/Cse4/CasC [Syntrophorhabdaceae bacterium]|nr:type I-E CRISPR-associated protein Cas7/Cse4/CasC [Syntrophorhabdaceae bacterium]